MFGHGALIIYILYSLYRYRHIVIITVVKTSGEYEQ